MAQYAADCAPARTLLVEHDITLDLYEQLLAASKTTGKPARQLRTLDTVREVGLAERGPRGDDVGKRPPLAWTRQAVALPNGVDLERFQPAHDPPEPAAAPVHRIVRTSAEPAWQSSFFLREVWPLARTASRVAAHHRRTSGTSFSWTAIANRVSVDPAQPGIEVEGFVADVAAGVPASGAGDRAPGRVRRDQHQDHGSYGDGQSHRQHAGGHQRAGRSGRRRGCRRYGARAWPKQSLISFAHPERRRSLERGARATAETRYDWDSIARTAGALQIAVACLTVRWRNPARRKTASRKSAGRLGQ